MKTPTDKSSALESRIEISDKSTAPKTPTSDPLRPIEPLPGQINKPIASVRRIPWWPIVGVLALILIATATYNSLGTITISTDPAADQITVNGKQIASNKKLWRLPGMKAQVVITKEGYVTFEKEYSFGYNTDIVLSQKLKKYPQATELSKDILAPVVLDKDVDGVKTLSTNKEYLLRITRNDKKVAKLNLEAIPNIENYQLPNDQKFVLLERTKEVGTLDFARQSVTSQNYKTFADNITSIALSPDGQETFYLEHNAETNQNYLTRDNVTHTAPDRYFDEAMLKKLGITEPILKWSPNGKTVMSIDKQVILIDLLNRKADKVVLNGDITDAWFVPDSSTILAVTSEKKLVSFDSAKISGADSQDANPPTKTSIIPRAYAADSKSDLGFADYNIFVKAETVVVVDKNNIVAVNNQNQLIGYNFATKKQVTYLLGNTIDSSKINAIAVDTKHSTVYILSGNNLYSQAIETSEY